MNVYIKEADDPLVEEERFLQEKLLVRKQEEVYDKNTMVSW